MKRALAVYFCTMVSRVAICVRLLGLKNAVSSRGWTKAVRPCQVSGHEAIERELRKMTAAKKLRGNR